MIVDRDEYRRLENDYSSFDGDVDKALADAQEFAESYCGRFFEKEERTEVVYMTFGRGYPKAVPVESVPAGYDIDGYAVTGRSNVLWEGYRNNYDALSFKAWYPNHSYQSITYTGGFEPEEMPLEVKQAVARIAHRSMTPSEFPAGATSVQVGDISYSGKGLSAGAADTSVLALLKPWRRRDVWV